MQKTYSAKIKDLKQKYYLVDASGKTLGRLASQIAKILVGKHKPEYTPNVVSGDFVIVVNASKIKVSGKKMEQKLYHSHSGYLGGLKETTLEDLLEKDPIRVIKLAVKGMLPKNKLRDIMMKHLKVYVDEKHPHEAQKPTTDLPD